MLTETVEILDTTLREGQQCEGVSFSLEEQIKIARLLDDFAVDFIEAGHPAVSKDAKYALSTINDLGLRAAVLGHSRAKTEDIQAVKDCGARWVGVFIGINELSLKYKYNTTKDKVYDMVRKSIEFARQKD
ncbi:trans-homoaconitate synthase, partial [Candidatus Magnetoovum chiemensis]